MVKFSHAQNVNYKGTMQTLRSVTFLHSKVIYLMIRPIFSIDSTLFEKHYLFTGEHNLILGLLERLFRDICVITFNNTIALSGLPGFRILVAQCDWVFDDTDEAPFTFRWVCMHVPGLDDHNYLINKVRSFVLEYWTHNRVELMLQGKLKKKNQVINE